jgi:hypothetical protein
MSHQHDHYDERQTRGGFFTLRTGLLFLGFAIIAGALLLTGHRAHVLGALIYLPLLLCPLMHIFGHGGHGGHGDHGRKISKGEHHE